MCPRRQTGGALRRRSGERRDVGSGRRPAPHGEAGDPARPAPARCPQTAGGHAARRGHAAHRRRGAAGWGKTSLLSSLGGGARERERRRLGLARRGRRRARRGSGAMCSPRCTASATRSAPPPSTRSPRPAAARGPGAARSCSTSWPRRRRRTCWCSTTTTCSPTRAIHEGIEFLVAYLPASIASGLAGRSDPPLPLARLRARGELTELRAADLRFSVDEAAELVSAVAGRPPGAARRPPGVGAHGGLGGRLQLAALAAARRAPAQVRGDDRHLLDYFTAEVLPGVAPRAA